MDAAVTAAHRHADRGSGLLSMTFGMMMFLVLLTMAVNITYNLYTTSVVTGLAIDAARDVAERPGSTPAEAEADFRALVGDNVDFDIAVLADTVEATVRWETNSILPSFTDARAFGVLDRTFAVRIEDQQDP